MSSRSDESPRQKISGSELSLLSEIGSFKKNSGFVLSKNLLLPERRVIEKFFFGLSL
jgi:hypothetical protein